MEETPPEKRWEYAWNGQGVTLNELVHLMVVIQLWIRSLVAFLGVESKSNDN